MMFKMKVNYGSETVDMGLVTRYSESFQKSVTTVPIVSKPTDDTFAVESGSGREVSVNFERVHPVDGVSNAQWYRELQAMVDRWQVRTDGAVMDVNPGDDNPYVPEREGLNGYVSNLTLTYRKGDPTRIIGNMGFATGTMYVSNEHPDPVDGDKGSTRKKSEFSILMSTPSNDSGDTSWYTLFSEETEVDCVQSYTLTGGAEVPFEVLTMIIPKRSLELVAPDLVDNIVGGKNKVIIDAVGKGMYTVAKCKLSGKNYRITAYCEAAGLTGCELEESMTLKPSGWIDYILDEGRYGVTFKRNKNKCEVYTAQLKPGDMIRFDKGTNVWYILQVCAKYLGCKLFFAEDKAFLVDCRADYHGTAIYTSPYPLSDYEAVSLYDRDKTSPYYAKTVGTPTLGDEGTDTIVNTVVVTCRQSTNSEDELKAFTFVDEDSKREFGEYQYSVSLPNFIQNTGAGYDQAGKFARSIMEYRREPQQSVTFTFKEIVKKGGVAEWQSTFTPMSRVPMIYSTADGFVVSNRSVLFKDQTVPQKLMLSSYERHYPEGTTTYTFGQISSIDLSSSTSELSSAVRN